MDQMPQSVNGQSPAYGFQPQPEPEYIGFLKTVLQALGDERNSWIGLGPMAGTIKGVGKLRNYFADKEAARMGGFTVPLQKMTHDIPLLKSEGAKGSEGLMGTTLPGPHQAYVDRLADANSMAKTLSGRQGTLLEQLQTRDAVKEMHPAIQAEIEGADKGQRALDQLNRQARTHEEGPPPEMIRRLFGFER